MPFIRSTSFTRAIRSMYFIWSMHFYSEQAFHTQRQTLQRPHNLSPQSLCTVSLHSLSPQSLAPSSHNKRTATLLISLTRLDASSCKAITSIIYVARGKLHQHQGPVEGGIYTHSCVV